MQGISLLLYVEIFFNVLFQIILIHEFHHREFLRVSDPCWIQKYNDADNDQWGKSRNSLPVSLCVSCMSVCLSVSWYLLHMTGNIPCFITFVQLELNLVARQNIVKMKCKQHKILMVDNKLDWMKENYAHVHNTNASEVLHLIVECIIRGEIFGIWATSLRLIDRT